MNNPWHDIEASYDRKRRLLDKLDTSYTIAVIFFLIAFVAWFATVWILIGG